MSLIIYVPIELNRFIDVDFFCAMRQNAFDEWWRRGFLLEQGWVMQKYAMGWMEAFDWRESYFRRNIFTDCVKQKVKQNITTKMRWFWELKKRAMVKALETFTWFCQGKVKKKLNDKNFLADTGLCVSVMANVYYAGTSITNQMCTQNNARQTVRSTIGTLYVVNLSSNFSVKSNFPTLIKGRKAQCARGKKFRVTNKNAKITKESFGIKITKANFKVEKIPLFNSKDIIWTQKRE